MEEVKRIYSLLLHSTGLKIKEIAKELDLDKYYVADVLFSSDNNKYWYHDGSSLWHAIEGAIQIEEEPEPDKLTTQIVLPKKSLKPQRFIQGNTSLSLRIYTSQLSKYHVYSEEGTLELFKRYRNGDRNAYELIIKSHQKLVAGISLLYTKYGVPLEDLIQEGNIGLCRAIERFDHVKYKHFSKFAKGWILQAVSTSIPNLVSFVRIPLNQFQLYCKILRFKEVFEQLNEYEPSVSDIDIGIEDNFKNLAFLNQLPDWLNKLVILYDDLDCFESQTNAIEELETIEENKYQTQILLRSLDNRKRQIVKSYYGIGTVQNSLDNIGVQLNLTRERVRQLVERSTVLMKKYMDIKGDEYTIGDWVRLRDTMQIGRIVDTTVSDLGDIKYVLKMNDEHKHIVYEYEIIKIQNTQIEEDKIELSSEPKATDKNKKKE